ncbi:MAG: diguanylate cyclase/phosphodiesterase [Rhodocyclaceae bacterium]|nr:diguanylate cyclase/phosphodiesterase [Rhodocyclaceae bacterium]
MTIRPWPASLRGRLVLLFVLVDILILALIVGNSLRILENHLAEQATQRLAAIREAYSAAVAGPLAARDYATLRDILDAWQSAEDISYLTVSDNSGRLLVASSGWRQGTRLPEPSPGVDPLGDTHVRFPVEFLGQRLGWVQYGISTRYIEQARHELFLQGGLLALLAIVVSTVLLWLAGYWLTRHLVALTEASARIASGEHGARFEGKGEDEVGVLGHNFNAMAAAVESRFEDLQRERERFQAIADYTYAWESWFDPQGKLVWVSPAVQRVTGYSPPECERMRGFPLPLVHGDDRPLLARQHAGALAGQTGKDLEFRVVRKDGQTVWVAMSWQPIFDAEGRSLGYRASVRDVTIQHQAVEELAFRATHDPLTGLYNRRAFEDYLKKALLESKVVSVLYIDLDQFKVVNDSCGHAAGDRLLQRLAQVLQSRFADGFLARLGGDEFGFVMRDCDLREAVRRAQLLVDEIRGLPFVWDGRSFRLGASVGVARSSENLATVATLLVAADTACYAAKERGRNRVETYSSNDSYYRERSAEILSFSEVSEALGAGSFVLYWQRMASLRPGLPEHAEILVRMVAADGSHVPPGKFIPAAERYGLAPMLDRWIIDQAFRQIAAIPDRQRVYAINISGGTLGDSGLTDFIDRCFATHGVQPAQICFEITESCAIANVGAALDFIQAMRRLGVSLALDDFGSGLSSFAYLRRFDVQLMKIDGLFVRNADQDGRDRAVVEAAVRLASALGLQTVAEYVCSESVLKVVQELGVDYAQGYAVHVPEPLPGKGAMAAPQGEGLLVSQP